MAVTALGHVLVLSDDIEATRDFYRDVLGLRAGSRPELEFPGYWMYADGGTGESSVAGSNGGTAEGSSACLHIAARGAYLSHAASIGLGEPPGDGTGQRAGTGAATLDHIAFDAPDYQEAAARIERCGLSAVRNEIPGGPRQLFVSDPNGVRVEINVR